MQLESGYKIERETKVKKWREQLEYETGKRKYSAKVASKNRE